MGRALTVDEYGILGTLLNMMLVLASPLDALRNAMAHFSARAEQQSDRAVVRALGRQWLGRMLGVGLLAGLTLMLVAPRVADFFHLESTLPVRVAGGLLPVMLCAPVVAGSVAGHAVVYVDERGHPVVDGAAIRSGLSPGDQRGRHRVVGRLVSRAGTGPGFASGLCTD